MSERDQNQSEDLTALYQEVTSLRQEIADLPPAVGAELATGLQPLAALPPISAALLQSTQALGTKCYFTAHGFLKALGRSTGKQNHVWLEEALDRLSATSVSITSGHLTYFGSLIEEGVRDEDTGKYVVVINPKLAKFYGRTQWTQIDWQQRQALRRKPLALWLHGFYAPHPRTRPLRGTLFRSGRSGREVNGLNHGRPHLRPTGMCSPPPAAVASGQGPVRRLRLPDRLEGQEEAVRDGKGAQVGQSGAGASCGAMEHFRGRKTPIWAKFGPLAHLGRWPAVTEQSSARGGFCRRFAKPAPFPLHTCFIWGRFTSDNLVSVKLAAEARAERAAGADRAKASTQKIMPAFGCRPQKGG